MTGTGRTGGRVHAYVLMPNHYHLLLETPEANLVAGMRSTSTMSGRRSGCSTWAQRDWACPRNG